MKLRKEKKTDPLDTPVMRQYLELKTKHADAILLFRMGDFYELFLEDAELAAPIMDVALTRRQQDIPMAGVPYHSAEIYISRLLGSGHKVAIAEQENDPENPKLMRRAVRRVISPGTVLEESLLAGAAHSYLMAVVPAGDFAGLALADISTGTFFCLEIGGRSDRVADFEGGESNEPVYAPELRDRLLHYAPREILGTLETLNLLRAIPGVSGTLMTPLEGWRASALEGARQIKRRYETNLRGLGFVDEESPCLGAASLILHYVDRNFPDTGLRLDPPVFREVRSQVMGLDEQTIRNLDLVGAPGQSDRARTLFAVLDECRTAPGKRYLREALLSPLLDHAEITRRQDSVEALVQAKPLRTELAAGLSGVHDLERMLARQSAGRGAPRDFVAVRETIRIAIELGPLLEGSAALRLPPLSGSLEELARTLHDAIVEEPPAVLGGGPLVREGQDEELDRARAASVQGSQWLADLERSERERTGITNLRIKYNRVAGYFIEVSKGQIDRVPEDYRRRQTLTGYERYSNPALDELRETIEAADQTITQIEERIFGELCGAVLAAREDIKALMAGLARLDFLLGMALVAGRHAWTRPELVADGALLEVRDGRHPVVERFLESAADFIPNDIILDRQERAFGIITGPNMAGKSTYIRQVALIQLLAQMGAWVPARSAKLGIVDRIFTRIGAQDNLTRGESTFFVEMLETARILNQVGPRSLVIMDEVGRGTSTYDGMSLAWAIVEHLSDEDGPLPLCLFATHYHELTALAQRDSVFNLTMDVQEIDGKVVFLHRVKEGAADRSYGIHVARLAGLPASVIERAEERLAELESEDERRRSAEGERSRGRRARRQQESAQEYLF